MTNKEPAMPVTKVSDEPPGDFEDRNYRFEVSDGVGPVS
jgi:hypothetical protein